MVCRIRIVRRLGLVTLAGLLLATGPRPAEAYSHCRVYLNGEYRLQRRESLPFNYRVNFDSLTTWAYAQPGPFAYQATLWQIAFIQAIQGYEAWEQVPWADVQVNYDGATGPGGFAQNGVNQVYFATNTSMCFFWYRSSGTNIGQIFEADIRLNTGVFHAGRLAAEMAQEAGHALGLDHSPVSDLFTSSTDNASMSVGLNAISDSVLSPDDIAGISTLYPYMTYSGLDLVERYKKDFGTISGKVTTPLGLGPINGAAVLAVDITTGGAVVGALSGTHNIPSSGLTGGLGTDGTGEYILPCLPAGTYVVVACPLLRYLGSTSRLQGNGFSATDLDQTFLPGARVVTCVKGVRTWDVDFDGNSGDVDMDGLWTSTDLACFDWFVANPTALPWILVAIVANTCDLNNDWKVDALDRKILQALVSMKEGVAVAASVF